MRRAATAAACSAALWVAWAAAGIALARADTVTFSSTGAEQTFTIPAGVTTMHVIAIGGRGGAGAGSSAGVGGFGATASADLSVTPGQLLYVEVASNAGAASGAVGGAGGFNGGAIGGGGGPSALGGGGGGGGSDIRTTSASAGGSLASRLVIAAGGAGGGSNQSGLGFQGGAGGSAGQPGGGGDGACSPGTTACGGSPGTPGARGAGGVGVFADDNGTDGALGAGGAGGGNGMDNAGGGGGGGLYGGGGGAAGQVGSGSGGGGGGGSSGFGAGATNTSAGADSTGTPSITFTYTAAPVNTAAPAISGTPGVGQTLSCSQGSWSGTQPISFSYGWLRDGGSITATSATYTVIAGDAGHTLACLVTATNSAGGASAPSAGVQIPGASLAFGAKTLVTLRLARRRIPVTGPVAVVVSNANGFAVTGKLSGETTKAVGARRIKLTAKAFRVAATAKTTVKLTLSKALRRLLGQKGKLSLRLTAKVKDSAGKTRTVTQGVSPKLKRKLRP